MTAADERAREPGESDATGTVGAAPEAGADGAGRGGTKEPLAILGGGNLGRALATGWAAAGVRRPREITLTRRRVELLAPLEARGFRTTDDNREAVRRSRIVVVAVQPQQLVDLLEEVRHDLELSRHLVVSVVSDVPISEIQARLGKPVPVVRAMPSIAVAIRESMTCLAAQEGEEAALARARGLFEAVGGTVVIDESLMVSATALVACGVAFFLRAVRAASQGGIEIGFHPEEALLMAAQTARGAASLLLEEGGGHPEAAIDRVTTPRGCTIAGLNEMEHQGFSSAMIKGILVSAEKAGALFGDG